MIRKEIELPIYKGILEICLSDNPEELNTIYCDNKDRPFFYENDVIYAHALIAKHCGDPISKKRYVVIFNHKNEVDKITHNVIAHEAFHMTGYIMEGAAVKYDPDNDEPFAYYIGWVAGEIYKFLNKRKIKIS